MVCRGASTFFEDLFYCCGFDPFPAVDADGGAALVAAGSGVAGGVAGGGEAGADALAA